MKDLIDSEIKFLKDFQEQIETRFNEWINTLSRETQIDLLVNGICLLGKEGEANLSIAKRIKEFEEMR